MSDRTPPAVTPTTPIGPDVDLEAEDLRLVDGTRLTEDRAAEIVDEVRRRVGRPSLTGEAAASPRIAFRISPSVRDRAAEIAAREGKTISQLAREALEERVAAGERRA
ncbi:CopG family transcriptional regulator [Geodermatophilus chilensis]|uniref:CopG family transcriptional regulator n=1 Tax=Geodermatophilus chilensis TaxID=2035835 RepID=UPI000C2663BD|nr:CopG family transcriptional regulator [Geodermatophilus chilensis]